MGLTARARGAAHAAPLLLLATLAACGWGEPETATWRQKLTITIDTPRGPRIGSAVTEIVLDRDAPFLTGEQGDGRQLWRGEAVLVDIGGGDAAWSAPRYLVVVPERPALLARIIGAKHDTFGEWTAKVAEAKGEPVELPPSVLRAYAFSDVTVARANEPTNSDEIDPLAPVAVGIPPGTGDVSAIEALFGPGVRWRSAVLEITDDPVGPETIRDLLDGWLGRPGDPPSVPLLLTRDGEPGPPLHPDGLLSPDRLPTPSWVTDETAYRETT